MLLLLFPIQNEFALTTELLSSWVEGRKNVNDIQLMLFLQEKRLAEEIAALEADTGFKLRVLAQNYPVTPGFLFYGHCTI